MDKEFLINRSNEITLNITDGKVDSYRDTDEITNTVRVYENGKIGVAGALGKCDFKELEKSAKEKLSDEIPYSATLNKGVVKEVIGTKEAIKKENILSATKRLAKKVAAACPKFLINGKTQLCFKEHEYKNSENTKLSHKNSEFSVFFQIKDRDSSNIVDAYYGAKTQRYGKSVEDKIVNEVKLLHDNFFKKIKVLPDGEYPVIMGVYDVFAHLIKDMTAEYYVSGGSLLSNKLGEKIFNENLSFYIDRNQKTNPLAAFFDAEGEIAKNYRSPIIENGVFKNVLTTKNSAAMFNLPISKTAASSYDGVPAVGLPGLYVKPAAEDVKSLLGKKKAIYLVQTAGGDITTDGNLGLPVMLAFLVENGELKGRVANFMASGNIFEVLGDKFIGVTEKDIFEMSESQLLVAKMKITSDKDN